MSNKVVHHCVVQITPPSESTGSPGVVAEGKYMVDGDTVTLTDHAGTPVKNIHGRAYSRKIGTDVPIVVARRLTKEFYLSRRGNKSDFNRPLIYKRDGSII